MQPQSRKEDAKEIQWYFFAFSFALLATLWPPLFQSAEDLMPNLPKPFDH